MALYEVSRTDAPGPGEFVSALVVAGGTAMARAHFVDSNYPGATAKNLVANRVGVNAYRHDPGSVSVLSTVFDDWSDPMDSDAVDY